METIDTEFKKVFNSVRSYLEFEKISGLPNIFSEKIRLYEKNSLKELSKDPKFVQFEKLKKEALLCKGCPLYKTRKNLVFGVGNINAKLFFVGEAPGREEDLQGIPFVGRAGELLTKIIEAIDLKRSDVYIGNILKCRPPENRAPEPDEANACINFLKRQIEIVKPLVICALGKHASQNLLNTEVPISKLRGKFCDYNGIKVMPTYHPAYLLRNPADKRLVWEDFKKIKAELLTKSSR